MVVLFQTYRLGLAQALAVDSGGIVRHIGRGKSATYQVVEPHNPHPQHIGIGTHGYCLECKKRICPQEGGYHGKGTKGN